MSVFFTLAILCAMFAFRIPEVSSSFGPVGVGCVLIASGIPAITQCAKEDKGQYKHNHFMILLMAFFLSLMQCAISRDITVPLPLNLFFAAANASLIMTLFQTLVGKDDKLKAIGSSFALLAAAFVATEFYQSVGNFVFHLFIALCSVFAALFESHKKQKELPVLKAKASVLQIASLISFGILLTTVSVTSLPIVLLAFAAGTFCGSLTANPTQRSILVFVSFVVVTLAAFPQLTFVAFALLGVILGCGQQVEEQLSHPKLWSFGIAMMIANLAVEKFLLSGFGLYVAFIPLALVLVPKHKDLVLQYLPVKKRND